MRYVTILSFMVLVVVISILSIPVVWIGLMVFPFLLILAIFLSPAFFFLKGISDTLAQRKSIVARQRVLLIDNELEVANLIKESMSQEWEVEHITTSHRGIGAILSFKYDLLLVRWSRHKLSGESILDYLDHAVFTRTLRNPSNKPANIPPVVFLRREDANLHSTSRRHRVPIVGYQNVDTSGLVMNLTRYQSENQTQDQRMSS